MQRLRCGSLTLDVGGYAQALTLIADRATHRGACLGYLNPHVYNQAAADTRVRSYLNTCSLVCLDGIGAAVAVGLCSARVVPRVVMHRVFDAAVATGLLRGRILLIGLDEVEIQLARAHLAQAAPDAQFVAVHHGFLGDAQYDEICRVHFDVDMVLVGMGSPRSERVSLLASQHCPAALTWHVGGGSLRQWAGRKRRAPLLVSRLGLEWVHRMVFEPETRTRYTRGIAQFACHLVADEVRRRTSHAS